MSNKSVLPENWQQSLMITEEKWNNPENHVLKLSSEYWQHTLEFRMEVLGMSEEDAREWTDENRRNLEGPWDDREDPDQY